MAAREIGYSSFPAGYSKQKWVAVTRITQEPVRFSSLFGDKDTLLVYSMMYGAQRKAPCPMCTSFLSAWNGSAFNLRERVAMADPDRIRGKHRILTRYG